MARPGIQKLFDSLWKEQLPTTYYDADVMRARDRVGYLTETRDDPARMKDMTKPEIKGWKERMNEEIADAQKALDHLVKEVALAEVKVILYKLTDPELKDAQNIGSRITADLMERYKIDPAFREGEIKSMGLLLDPNGLFGDDVIEGSDDGSALAANRNAALEGIVEQILTMDGKPRSWAEEIDDDDPDMELTEAEGEELEVDDRLMPDESAEVTLDVEERRRKILAEKRERLVKERIGVREKRKESLLDKGYEHLIETLFRYKIIHESSVEGANLTMDQTLFYSVRDPELAESYAADGVSRTRHGRFFETPGQLRALREDHPSFYGWLWVRYNQLQAIKTREDLERIAQSDLFRHLLRERGGV